MCFVVMVTKISCELIVISTIGHLLNHMFVVRVCGVKGLSVFDSTVWGEADCFVQYHFPAASGTEEAGGDIGGFKGSDCFG